MKFKYKLLCFWILLICNCFLIKSQSSDTTNKNSIYLELLGNSAILYNITYDRIIHDHNNYKLSLGIGGQYLSDLLSISPQINLLYGQRHNLEIGAGLAYNFFSSNAIFIIRLFGYRYQNPKNRLLFKIGFTPMIAKPLTKIGSSDEYKIYPWGGIAIGYTI